MTAQHWDRERITGGPNPPGSPEAAAIIARVKAMMSPRKGRKMQPIVIAPRTAHVTRVNEAAPVRERTKTGRLPRQLGDALTDREVRVATLLAHGMTQVEIARVIGIGRTTCGFVCADIRTKIGLEHHAALVAWARHTYREQAA